MKPSHVYGTRGTRIDHKLRNVVHDAWAKIVKKLEIDCTMAELKKKKDGLMATYRKLAHKVRNTEKSATGEVYKPEWFAYDFMNKFLNGVYRPHVYYQYWEVKYIFIFFLCNMNYSNFSFNP